MKAYIISYLPDDITIREKRYQAHQEQINWLKDNNLDILVSYRNYQFHEFNKSCDYIEQPYSENRLKPAVARNQLLETFYNSNDEWGLFLDDDSILDHRGQNIIPDIDIIPKSIGVFCPLLPNVPGKGAWKQYFKTDEPRNSWIFITGDIKGSFMFIRNISERLYFRDDVIAGEDLMFGYDMVNLGYGSYWCKNMILKESFGSGKASCTWNESEKDRTEIHKMVQQNLIDTYGFQMSKTGLQKSELYKRNNILKKITIPKNKNELFF